jgi:hypothetical protein
MADKPHRKGITYRKQVKTIDRLKNSRNGNARFFLRFTDGTDAKTAPDSSYAADVENWYNAQDGRPFWVAFMVDGRGNLDHIARF